VVDAKTATEPRDSIGNQGPPSVALPFYGVLGMAFDLERQVLSAPGWQSLSSVALSKREPALIPPQPPTPSSESSPSPRSFEPGDENVVHVTLIQEWVVEF
jgi:hypothetical protein